MKILFAGSEALPFCSTGGLGDVLGSLPRSLKELGGEEMDVRVVLPLYGAIPEKFRAGMTFLCEIRVKLAWRSQYCGIYSYELDGVTYYFLDNEYYFKRPSMYGEMDDGERFAFFGKAIIDCMAAVDFFPDILHANDWQTGMSIVYLKRHYSGTEPYANIKTVYTIHNIDYQGVYDMGLLGDIFDVSDYDGWLFEHNGAMNITKAAILCADQVSTVSEHYADEIQTPFFSSGLDSILGANSFKLRGILNGIDYTYYDPATDPDIAHPYTARAISGKAKNKEELQRLMGLPVKKDVPVIAMISRLVEHKGFDLVECILEEIVAHFDVQIVVLGTGSETYENYFRYLSAKYSDKVAARIAFDKALSKKIYAGADLFLMPSLREACGLSQMIASRYGTVPIVRETGGLYDTIHPYLFDSGDGNGFTFTNYNAHDMKHVILEACGLFHDKQAWKALVKNVMKVDFSWNVSAKKYSKMYEDLLK